WWLGATSWLSTDADRPRMFNNENAVKHAPVGEPAAVLFDFGGVLTTSLLDAFAAFSEEVSGDPTLLFNLLTADTPAARALVEHEEGRIPPEEFEHALAVGFASHGV